MQQQPQEEHLQTNAQGHKAKKLTTLAGVFEQIMSGAIVQTDYDFTRLEEILKGQVKK